MIALDTNILVRFLVRDDEKQAQAVYARFKQAEVSREVLFVSALVVLETLWVLESAYEKSRLEILDAFDEMKSMPILEFEKTQAIQRWVDEGRTCNADLSDLLIAMMSQDYGCSGVITFDKKAAKYAFFRLLT